MRSVHLSVTCYSYLGSSQWILDLLPAWGPQTVSVQGFQAGVHRGSLHSLIHCIVSTHGHLSKQQVIGYEIEPAVRGRVGPNPWLQPRVDQPGGRRIWSNLACLLCFPNVGARMCLECPIMLKRLITEQPSICLLL